jgi:hypothetical protein
LYDSRTQLFGDSDPPRHASSDSFTGNDAFSQPAKVRGSVHAQDLRDLADGINFALRRLGR